MFLGNDSDSNNYDWVYELNDEKLYELLRGAIREQKEKEHNVRRNKQGRLLKGSRLAQKDNIDKEKIKLMRAAGMTVNQIKEIMGCSKSTIYNILKCKEK